MPRPSAPVLDAQARMFFLQTKVTEALDTVSVARNMESDAREVLSDDQTMVQNVRATLQDGEGMVSDAHGLCRTVKAGCRTAQVRPRTAAHSDRGGHERTVATEGRREKRKARRTRGRGGLGRDGLNSAHLEEMEASRGLLTIVPVMSPPTVACPKPNCWRMLPAATVAWISDGVGAPTAAWLGAAAGGV